jgi:hypothetical protein
MACDRALLTRHEAGHVAGLVLSGRVPARVGADWPFEAVQGVTTLDFSDDGINPDSARDFMLMILLGPLAEERPGWPPEWPLDRNSESRDAQQLAVLADYLGLDEEGWVSLVRQAEETAAGAGFKQMVNLIASALEKLDELDSEQVRFLIGPEVCRRYDIEPAKELTTNAAKTGGLGRNDHGCR